MQPRGPGIDPGHRQEFSGWPAADLDKRRREARRMRLGARVASDAGGLAGNPGTTGARCMWTELRGRGAGGEAAEMTGCDPSALDARLERLRNVGESDL